MKSLLALTALATWLAGAHYSCPALAEEELPQPPVVRSESGVLDTRLELRNGTVPVAGRQLTLGMYEGSLPGPTWRVKPGDLLRVHLINRLSLPGQPPPEAVQEICEGSGPAKGDPEGADRLNDPRLALATNLSAQGLEVGPAGKQGDPFLRIAPGEACRYEIRLPKDQPAGLFWYHPDFHGSAAKQAWQGMAGAIVVEGPLDEVPEVKAAGERLLVLQELWVDRSGYLPQGVPVPAAGGAPFTTLPATPANFYYPVNGVLQPAITLRPGETQRWRILASSPHRVFFLQLDGHPLHLLALDGIAVESARTVENLLLAPGNRAEVMVKAGAPGTYWLRALRYEQGHPGGPRPELQLLKVVVAGEPVDEASAAKLPNFLGMGRASVYAAPITARRTIVCGDGAADGAGPAPGDRPRIKVRAGDVEEWKLVNRDVVQHPFQLRANPFQVLRIDQIEVRDGSWRDTFLLPPQGEVTIRTRFRPDLTGTTFYHCQSAPLEDWQPIGVLEIAPAASATPSPKKGGQP